jgi:ABC-type nitrate/sulfonate/bicarbonate transport system permease component
MFSIPGVLAWMFLFIAIMLVVERFLLVRFENRVLRWRPQER